MTLERRSPLPVARYWVTAFGEKEPALAAYLHLHSRQGSAQVTVTEHIDETSDHPAGSFFVFIIKRPDMVTWNAELFGFPNLAGADITSLADTVDRPDMPGDGFDAIGDFVKEAAGAAGDVVKAVAALALGFGGLWLLSRMGKGR